MKNTFLLSTIIITFFAVSIQLTHAQSALNSIETDYTISNVRTATAADGEYIIANSYEGTLSGIDYDGTILWTNSLSGFMNHDVWCDDLTGDGIDEIVAVNADGNVYCLDSNGNLLWQFMQREVPMFSVCIIKNGNTPYVVVSSLDLSIYYLSADGELVKEIPSSTYSQENTWGNNAPPSGTHLANFVRKIKKANGAEDLVVHGCVNTNSTNGSLYIFNAFADTPYNIIEPTNDKPIGDIRVTNYFGDGQEKIFMGSSTARGTTDLNIYNQNNGAVNDVEIHEIINELGGFGYRVVQTEVIPKGGTYEYFCLVGSGIALIPANLNLNNAEILNSNYSFNDMWLDRENERIILASSQSGGSSIHIIDFTNSSWKNAYENINPPGNIQKILDNTQAVRNNLATFTAPDYQLPSKEVFFVSDLSSNINNNSDYVLDLANEINSNYDTPKIMASVNLPNVQDPADWNRDTMPNAVYREKRDSRKNYVLTQSAVESTILPNYNNFIGLSYWGGHGNDPYMFSLKTKKALIDGAAGKKTILIYPELQDDSENFEYVIKNLMYPLAKYARTRNTQIHLRNKHIFWQGAAYGHNWRSFLTGDYADVFVPTMEQTGDKSMELAMAARVGIWASGVVNQWGDRAVPDNASYYRLRQHSHQRLPNHHLRQVIYAAASGATHFNNFRVDVEYTSLVWELIAKGALYVPGRGQILSFSPVHLSMTQNPDPYYLNEGANTKWLTAYDETTEENNKLVFSRLNGSWPGAPVTDWDFSRYAANETERRLNYIPRYNNGLVLITPVQDGVFAQEYQSRGRLDERLHPMYADIMTEYITDGRNYYSADNSQTFAAESYYTTIQEEIEEKSELLPLTVSGDAGWVVAQTDSLHLRLTLVDGAWLNPSDKTVTVSFHSVTPTAMTDILDGTEYDLSDLSSIDVNISCGMFRFIEISLAEELEVVSTEEIENSIDFDIFPNPASDLLTVEFEMKSSTAQFELTDVLGRVLQMQKLTNLSEGQQTVQFDISAQAAGTYLVRWKEGGVAKAFVK